MHNVMGLHPEEAREQNNDHEGEAGGRGHVELDRAVTGVKRGG